MDFKWADFKIEIPQEVKLMWSWILLHWRESFFGVVIIIMIVISVTNGLTSCSTAEVKIVSEQVTEASFTKGTVVKLTNNLAYKDCNLESTIDIAFTKFPISENSIRGFKNERKEKRGCQFCNEEESISKKTEPTQALSPNFKQGALQISQLHQNVLSRRLLSEQWDQQIQYADFSNMDIKAIDILGAASYVSIKFISFLQNGTAQNMKAAYVSNNFQHKFSQLPQEIDKSYSNYFRFKRYKTCQLTQHSEVVVFPIKIPPTCSDCYFKENALSLYKCKQSSKEINSQRTEILNAPNIIMSFLICH